MLSSVCCVCVCVWGGGGLSQSKNFHYSLTQFRRKNMQIVGKMYAKFVKKERPLSTSFYVHLSFLRGSLKI